MAEQHVRNRALGGAEGPLELVACAIIGAGILMLLQPFFMALYTWSFATMLTGTVISGLFIVLLSAWLRHIF